MRTLDIAMLYLRIAVGGMLLLHNVGKLQNYNEIIGQYHQMGSLSGTMFFFLFCLVETLAAVMVIIGWRLRIATSVLIIGTILVLSTYFPDASTKDLELNVVYIFVYIYIFIAGAGLYSFDGVRSKQKKVAECV